MKLQTSKGRFIYLYLFIFYTDSHYVSSCPRFTYLCLLSSQTKGVHQFLLFGFVLFLFFFKGRFLRTTKIEKKWNKIKSDFFSKKVNLHWWLIGSAEESTNLESLVQSTVSRTEGNVVFPDNTIHESRRSKAKQSGIISNSGTWAKGPGVLDQSLIQSDVETTR